MSTAHPELAMAAETGAAHGEYTLQLLRDTPADRRAPLIEGAKIRLGRFIADNLPNGAPADAILAAAYHAFDDAITSPSGCDAYNR